MNLEKSLDCSIQVSGLIGAKEFERTDEGHVDSSNEQDVSIDLELSSAATEDEVTNHSGNAPQSKLKEVNASKISLVENAAVLPSFIKQPTLSTPKRASTRMIKVSSDSHNKENIYSGSKTAPAKKRSKIVKDIAETITMLDNPSLVKLSNKLKELAHTQK
ncbi:hypothetical protein AAHA92_02626 [Salvia divinorum]|uniref:Uncharacterized protein n=1 Tax=Salvia divinorum TaxID=28513 RepID=A0ABD1IFC9_SALDI